MTTILLMGSQNDFLSDLTEILNFEGFDALIATHDEVVLNQQPPNLIVYDVTVPTMDSQQLSPDVQKTLQAEIPVLCLTTDEPQDWPDVSYLIKPFAIPDLLGKLKQVLAQPA
jgi:DNA-binding response OmpR family regulator